ncbi:MAG: putative protease [Bradyrhizobium sp.]|nr:putative protease [Bradyrhizobium sp.]
MGTLEDQLRRLRRFNAGVAEVDPVLAEERADRHDITLEAVGGGDGVEAQIALESIVMRRERPVLAIKKNVAELIFADPIESAIWKSRLETAAPVLAPLIPAVGRIELQGSPYEWIGTGWLVADDIIVTNRHVAEEFVTRGAGGLSFRMGDAGRINASIDFLEEFDCSATLVFELLAPLHIEPAPGADVAFFRVATVSGDTKLAQPIPLAASIGLTENVAVIGYPGYDSRIPEPSLMERIYGGLYNKKRLAPGGITRVEATQVWHNCTTLGGCSGGALISLDTGEALGLHFSGTFLTTNYAVRADIVRTLRDNIGKSPIVRASPQGEAPASGITGASSSARVTIPLTVTVSIDVPGSIAAASVRPVPPPEDSGPDTIQGVEARVEDYHDREGYRSDFLGFEVPLPSVDQHAADILEYSLAGETKQVLPYEHYSVVMSRSRRQCFFSAVNIDGKLSRKNKRAPWKWDPRIPRNQQIMNECYGNPPRFSRGHMTRREDPGWGDEATAKRGNEDSMHVTNTTPQMQSFNAPIWLALEDYALEHAREDAMKISVFTGPYFSDADPTMYGVRIPLAFWKVIAFIHDETGQLSATGYEMNQAENLLPEEEFVFGAFTSPQRGIATQVKIGAIELRSGISFGGLAGIDPLAADSEALDEGMRPPLQRFEQIRFI